MFQLLQVNLIQAREGLFYLRVIWVEILVWLQSGGPLTLLFPAFMAYCSSMSRVREKIGSIGLVSQVWFKVSLAFEHLGQWPCKAVSCGMLRSSTDVVASPSTWLLGAGTAYIISS